MYKFFVSKRTYFSLLLAVMLSACTHIQTARPQIESYSATNAEDGVPLVMGNTFTLFSKTLDMDRRLSIRVPYGYDLEQTKDKSYPVVYVIDGGPEQDFPHIAGLAQSREVNGTFSSFILVGIETINRRHQIVPPATDVATYEAELGQKPGGSAQFRQFIGQDVIPWINERYRTNGREVVMGESLAGLFVIETLFEDPNLFDDYIAVTPSMWWENMKYGIEASNYLKRLPAQEKRLYITSADEGYRHQEGIDYLIAALENNAPENLHWIYFARGAHETHASIYHVAALDAFRIFFPVTSRYGLPGSLLSGHPSPTRTPEQEALLEQECAIETAQQLTPGENQTLVHEMNAYQCLIFDYAGTPTAGNMRRFTSADSFIN